MNEWIKCTDKLPNLGEKVLVTTQCEELKDTRSDYWKQVQVSEYTRKGFLDVDGYSTMADTSNEHKDTIEEPWCVTAWMYLPKSFEEDE